MNPAMISDLQANLAQRDQLIAQLLSRVEAMELQSAQSANKSPSTQKPNSAQKASAGKKKAAKALANSPQVTVTPPAPARKKAITTSSNKVTPVRQRARSATPVSVKKSPLQMTKRDHPEGFEHTKNAFFVHIKVLWGLIAQGSVPKPPSEEQLRAFYQRFRCTEEIESAINGGPALLAVDAIETLKKARASRMKVGKHMINLSDFNIRYIHSSLSKLGLASWVPNLDEQADSLYNVAHKMAALKTFRECVAGGAYTYMNVNSSYVDDLDLLGRAYEHYVHFSFVNVYKKERKEQGKNQKDEKRKLLQTARERLAARRYKFAVSHNFPKRYLEVIKPIQAHSDDEYFPKKDIYIVKKLPFRSQAANTFFRRLDKVMKQSEIDEGTTRASPRRRIRVKNGPETIFPKAPKQMPLDFYDEDWFNMKLPAQRQALANLDSVAFIENPLDSLRFVDPIEKASHTRFVEARWDAATKGYNLDFLEKQEADEESEEEDQDHSDYGGSIDLDYTSGEEDDDEDEEDEEEDNDEEMVDDGDKGVGGSGSRRVDEDFEEFDDVDEEMDMEYYGKGSYTGGVAEDEWNAWQ